MIEKGIYKVQICRNGDEPFYIRVIDSGEFSLDDFNGEEFYQVNDTYINPINSLLIDNEYCAIILDGPIDENDVSQDIIESITESYNISNIKLYKDCSTCNKTGYGLEDVDGNIYYPENSDDLEIYEGKVIYASYKDSENYYKVFSYMYQTQDHDGVVEILDGCYNDFPSDVTKSTNTTISTGRCISPDVLTQKCTKC